MTACLKKSYIACAEMYTHQPELVCSLCVALFWVQKQCHTCLQLMATSSPQLPLAQAWFKATALGCVPLQQSHLQHDPFGSGGKTAVAASEFSCQVSILSLASLLRYSRSVIACSQNTDEQHWCHTGPERSVDCAQLEQQQTMTFR